MLFWICIKLPTYDFCLWCHNY